MTEQFTTTPEPDVKFFKVDESLGLIFGWAIVSTLDGEPYFDLGNPSTGEPPDHIPDHAMLEATTDFMKSRRVACEMHQREPGPDGQPVVVQDGGVIHSFPLTAEIAKAMEIESRRTGWMVAMAPDNPETLAKARDGVYTGFSIGGERIHDVPVED